MDFAAKHVETSLFSTVTIRAEHGGKHFIRWTTFVHGQCTERGSSTVLGMLHVESEPDMQQSPA